MSAVKAGRAYIEFFLNDKEFKKGLANAGDKLKKFGAIGAAATAPLVAALTGAVATFITVGDELQKMSLRTGLSVESLSELKYAASQSGTSIQSIEKATKKMAVGIIDAARGSGTLFESLQYLGVSIEDIQKLSPEEQFLTLSRAIANVRDPTMRAALAQKVFGRAGTELLPMLASGAEGLDALRSRAHELGLTFGDETANSAAVLGDNLADVKDQMIALAVNVGAALAGPLTEFAQWLQAIIGRVIEFVQNNPNLVRAIAAVTAGIAAASAAAITFGVVLAIISAHPIIAALTAIAALVIAIATYFGFASDGASEFSSELAKVKQQAGVDNISAQQANQAARANAVQQQLSVVSQQAITAPVAVSATPQELTFMKQALEGIERWTEQTAKNTKDMLRYMVAGADGLLAGAG